MNLFNLIIQLLIILIAIQHFYILWIEMFAWTTKGKKVFKSIPEELFEKTKIMAANQGLYNGFLATGLLWSIFLINYSSSDYPLFIALFFLLCVSIAGIYGGITVAKRIFYIQAVPALCTILLIIIQFLQFINTL